MIRPENSPILPILMGYGTRKDFYHLTEEEGLTRLQVGLQLFEKNDRLLFAFMRKQFWSWAIPTAVLTSTQLQLFTSLVTSPNSLDACEVPLFPHFTGMGTLIKAVSLGQNEHFTHQQYALLHTNTASLFCPYWKTPESIVTLPTLTVRELSKLL